MTHPLTSSRLLSQESALYDPAVFPANTSVPGSSAHHKEQSLDSVPRQPSSGHHKSAVRWIPLPFHRWFWVPLLVLMLLLAIGLEIALYFSNKNKGWPVSQKFTSEAALTHYAYTLPPVIIAMVLVASWSYTDTEIMRIQPYVDLVHGDSPPQKSLLLDYTRDHTLLVWRHAAKNKHYIVALSSLLGLLTLLFQPFASALFNVQDTVILRPDANVNNLAVIGLNQDAQFQDLTLFVTAAGFASASVLYKLDDPPFVFGEYTVAPFQLPTGLTGNGTVTANTTAITSDTGCENAVFLNKTQLPGGAGWTNFANASNGCSSPWDVDTNSTRLFEVFPSDCPNNGGTPEEFRPVVFWFFAYNPVLAAAVFCSPSIKLWDVTVTLDLATANITSITPLRPFTASSNFASSSGNVTGAPLNGRAFNGVAFNVTNSDRFTLARQNATQLILPAAVLQSAETSPEGLTSIYSESRFVDLSTKVYMTYLKLIAKTVYFVPAQIAMPVHLQTIEKRLRMSALAVHVITVILFIVSIGGIVVHVLHRRARSKLVLSHEPGTIASAVSLGARTKVASLLHGRQNTEDIAEALKEKKFGIDPGTMMIITEGEEGYDDNDSPDPRKSFFGGSKGYHSLRQG